MMVQYCKCCTIQQPMLIPRGLGVPAVDWGWLKGPDESTAYFYHLHYTTNTFVMVIGVSACNWWPCPMRHGLLFPCLPWILPHCAAGHTGWEKPQSITGCDYTFQSLPQNICHHWCSSTGLWSSSNALDGTLSLPYPSFRCAKWFVLINYRVQAHKSCKRTMALIKPLQGPRPDTTYQPVDGQAGSTACQFY